MCVHFSPLVTAHITALRAQLQDRLPGLARSAEGARAVVGSPYAFACFTEERLLGIGGLVSYWPTRAVAFVIPDRVPRKAWPAITRKVVAVLERAHADGVVRIEAHTADGDAGAERWAERLGFVPESDTPQRCWLPDLSDAWPLVRLGPQALAARAA